MKKKNDNVMNESCIIMNITKTQSCEESSKTLGIPIKESFNVTENSSLPLNETVKSPSISPDLEIDDVKSEPDSTKEENDSVLCKSPPLSSLGPGAEIKGKIGHPIPACVKEDNEDDEVISEGEQGGRLTFFKEGKLLLELSHRTDQGSWFQVKSKTYWPPPSTTAATISTIHHPLRHDTPTTTDDCSSVNSSPSLNEHIRKQSNPFHRNVVKLSPYVQLFYQATSVVKESRKSIKCQRNPFIETYSNNVRLKNNSKKNGFKFPKRVTGEQKKLRLQDFLEHLSQKCLIKIDSSLNIYKIFQKVDITSDSQDSSYVTPRKRYHETLSDSHSTSKKKAAGLAPSVSLNLYKNCDKPSYPSPTASPSRQLKNRSAISNHQHTSSYSIDSLLSNSESDKRSDSFLRSLLNQDKPPRSKTKDSSGDHSQRLATSGSPYSKESSREMNGDSSSKKRQISDRFDSSKDAQHSSFLSQSYNSMYLNPYFDPRYLMLQSLSTPPPYIQSPTPPTDVASAVAAAAAAAGYPMSPLQINALAANGALLPPGLSSPIAPSGHLRSPTPSRASPLSSIAHSPSPKHSSAPPQSIGSSNLWAPGSPRDLWAAASVLNSPLKYVPSPTSSPPPQDAPLNLSKPRTK